MSSGLSIGMAEFEQVFISRILLGTREILESRGIRFVELHRLAHQYDFQSRSEIFYLQILYPQLPGREVAEIRVITIPVAVERFEDLRQPEEFVSWFSHRMANYVEHDYRKHGVPSFEMPEIKPPNPPPSLVEKRVRFIRVRARE
jgi:hypothetical protein